jgi:hypothetical protein
MLMMDMLLAALALASVVSIGLLFLPALIEFKKPRDAGPRLIVDVFRQNCSNNKTSLVNSEAEPKLDCIGGIEGYSCIDRNLES